MTTDPEGGPPMTYWQRQRQAEADSGAAVQYLEYAAQEDVVIDPCPRCGPAWRAQVLVHLGATRVREWHVRGCSRLEEHS